MTPDDNWSVLTNGVRIDWTRGADEWTVDGGVRTGDGHTTLEASGQRRPGCRAADRRRVVVPNRQRAGPVDASWRQRVVAAGAVVGRDPAPDRFRRHRTRTAFDADVQYHVNLGARHDLVAGGGYRFMNDHDRPELFGVVRSARRSRPPSPTCSSRTKIAAHRTPAPDARNEARARYVFRVGSAADGAADVGSGETSACLDRGVARAADAVAGQSRRSGQRRS